MRKRGKIQSRLSLAALLIALLLPGCGKSQVDITESVGETLESSLTADRGIIMYHVEGNTITAETEKLQPKQPDSVNATLEEVMSNIRLSEGITYSGYTVGGNNAVTLSFQEDERVTSELSLLEKAAVVSTLGQIKDIGDITLAVTHSDGKTEEETLQSGSFYYYDDVIPTGQNNGRITLYLPNESGDGFEETTLAVTLGLDTSVEEEVLNQLISRGIFAAGTRLLSVSVIQKVAYVDMSPEFENGATAWQLAAMTNSVVKLPHISSVQLLIDGEKRETIAGVDTHVPLKFFIPETGEENTEE